jgi:hypothetical protein
LNAQGGQQIVSEFKKLDRKINQLTDEKVAQLVLVEGTHS